MIGINFAHAFSALLCISIALFYLFRLVGGRAWMSHFDPENEVGHGLMAIGMIFMLVPTSLLPSLFIGWNILLFAFASLWFCGRLFAQKPLLALLSGRLSGRTTFQSDAIHVLMHSGMCYMFLLISSMSFSMMQPIISVNCIVFVAFALLTFYYVRESYRDLQATTRDWLQFGANIAHVLMSGVMSWMFLEMIIMTMSMRN